MEDVAPGLTGKKTLPSRQNGEEEWKTSIIGGFGGKQNLYWPNSAMA